MEMFTHNRTSQTPIKNEETKIIRCVSKKYDKMIFYKTLNIRS